MLSPPFRPHLPNVFFAGVELNARTLRWSLRVGSYSLKWDPETQRMTLSAEGGEEILRVTCSHESPLNFARGFGFPEREADRNEWSIFVPNVIFEHDGSDEANRIAVELALSGLPYRVKSSGEIALTFSGEGNRRTNTSGFTTQGMIDMIREEARRYAIAPSNER